MSYVRCQLATVFLEWMTTNTTSRGRTPYNGQLAWVQEALRTYNSTHLFADLYRSGELIDPVIGMRLDPENPKFTVGAIDPADYEGTLNWVELEPDNKDYTQYHVFKFDGFKGRNGSFAPYPDSPMLAAIDARMFQANRNYGPRIDLTSTTVFINIATPDNLTYLSSSGFVGPLYNNTLDIHPQYGLVSVACAPSSLFPGEDVPPAYVYMSVAINGVAYQIENRDLVRSENPIGLTLPGFCNLGITTNNLIPREPKSILGLPFLRSVYM